jgi:hypothetical protein
MLRREVRHEQVGQCEAGEVVHREAQLDAVRSASARPMTREELAALSR